MHNIYILYCKKGNQRQMSLGQSSGGSYGSYQTPQRNLSLSGYRGGMHGISEVKKNDQNLGVFFKKTPLDSGKKKKTELYVYLKIYQNFHRVLGVFKKPNYRRHF